MSDLDKRRELREMREAQYAPVTVGRLEARLSPEYTYAEMGYISGYEEATFVAPVRPERIAYKAPDRIEDLEYVGAAMVTTIVSYLISQIPLIITILKGLGYFALAEELVELISGTTGLTNVDDVVQSWIAQRVGVAPGLPGGVDTGLAIGKSGDPTDYKVGQVREGWEIQKKTKYNYGKEYLVNCWYKPFDDEGKSKVGAKMNFREKCGYYQGIRVQTVTGREAKYRAYRRGFDDGAKEQQEAERSAEGGTTGLVQYSRSRRRRR